jgi:hypothetical protein
LSTLQLQTMCVTSPDSMERRIRDNRLMFHVSAPVELAPAP